MRTVLRPASERRILGVLETIWGGLQTTLGGFETILGGLETGPYLIL